MVRATATARAQTDAASLLSYQIGLPISIMYKPQRAVLNMLLMVHKLPQLAAAVEVPHLQLAIVAACQQAALLRVQCHGCKAGSAVAALEVTLATSSMDVPHADCAALIAADHLHRKGHSHAGLIAGHC